MRQFIKNLLPFASKPELLNVVYDSKNQSENAIVFLHGIAANAKSISNLSNKFKNSPHRIIVIDLLGFGESPKPKDLVYDQDEHVRHIRHTLKKLKVKKPFVLVGHSMGAIISLHYAYLHMLDVKELFLIGMPIYPSGADETGGIIKHSTNIYRKLYHLLREHPERTVRLSERIDKLIEYPGGLDLSMDNWHAFQSSLENTVENQDCIEELNIIPMNAHLIYGKKDKFVNLTNLKLIRPRKQISITKVDKAAHVINDQIASVVYRQIVNSIT